MDYNPGSPQYQHQGLNTRSNNTSPPAKNGREGLQRISGPDQGIHQGRPPHLQQMGDRQQLASKVPSYQMGQSFLHPTRNHPDSHDHLRGSHISKRIRRHWDVHSHQPHRHQPLLGRHHSIKQGGHIYGATYDHPRLPQRASGSSRPLLQRQMRNQWKAHMGASHPSPTLRSQVSGRLTYGTPTKGPKSYATPQLESR